MTGVNAMVGSDCLGGVRAAQMLYPNTSSFTFAYGDHAGDAKTGISEFKRLVEHEHAIGVLGNRSQIFMAINPISLKNQIPVIGMVGHPDFLSQNRFAFRAFPSVDLETAPLAGLVRERGLTRVASVTVEDEWTIAFQRAFKANLTGGPVKFVYEQTVLPEEIDFRSVSARVVRSNAEAVLINLTVGRAGTIIRQLREAGFDGLILSDFWGGHPDALKAAGPTAADNLYFVTVKTDFPHFLAALKKAYPEEEATGITYCCFVAASLVSQVCGDGTCSSAEALQGKLTKVSNIELPDGNLVVKDREVVFPVVVKHVTKGKVV
jgi:ABC-type branched-subunit amino acid transport system substrate-binding protein